MSTTLLGVFVGSVIGAAALVVYSVAIILEGRRQRPLPALEAPPVLERPTRRLAKPPTPGARPLPGLPPEHDGTVWVPQQRKEKFFAVGSVAEPLRNPPRASQPPVFRRAVFIDQEFADDSPTQQLTRPFLVGDVRRPTRGRA